MNLCIVVSGGIMSKWKRISLKLLSRGALCGSVTGGGEDYLYL